MKMAILRMFAWIINSVWKYEQILKRFGAIILFYFIIYQLVFMTYTENHPSVEYEEERNINSDLFEGYLNDTKNIRPYNESAFAKNFSTLFGPDFSDFNKEKDAKKEKEEKNFTLIDIQNFQIKINPNVCDKEKIGLVVVVHSAVPNTEARQIIRDTWGKPIIPDVNIRLVFILGVPQDTSKQNQIDQESNQFNDIVQGDFLDTYRNLSYKNVLANLWTSNFCPQAEFSVKTDDDMFLDLYAIYQITRPYLTSREYLLNKFLLCPIFSGLSVIRDTNSKWYVTEKELKDKTYPPYCTGWIYISTPKTSKRLVDMAQTNDFLWVDDVWVTGYLVRAANIRHINLMKYFTMMWERAVLVKSIQNEDIYYKDIIAAPTHRDLEIASVLSKNAERCFRDKCYNNVYSSEPTDSLSLTGQRVFDKLLPTHLPM